MSAADVALKALELAHSQPSADTRARAAEALLGLRASVSPADWPQLERLAGELRRGTASPLHVWTGLARGLGELELPRLAHRVDVEASEPPRISRALGKALEVRAVAHETRAGELRAEAAKLLRGSTTSPTVLQAAARSTGAAEAHEAFAGELREMVAQSRKQPAQEKAPEARERPEAGPVPIHMSQEEPT